MSSVVLSGVGAIQINISVHASLRWITVSTTISRKLLHTGVYPLVPSNAFELVSKLHQLRLPDYLLSNAETVLGPNHSFHVVPDRLTSPVTCRIKLGRTGLAMLDVEYERWPTVSLKLGATKKQ